MPLAFIPNRGQMDGKVDFVARSGSQTFWFMAGEVVFDRTSGDRSAREVVHLCFVGANGKDASGLDELPGRSNFFWGTDPDRWITSVPNYGGVIYTDLYPGIDLAYHGSRGNLKSEFLIEAGADPKQILLAYNGIEGMSINESDELVLNTALGELVEGVPVAYQKVGETRKTIEAAYNLLDDGLVGFALGDYDTSLPLVIDPLLSWSSFLGGDGWDDGMTICYDSVGNIYAVGCTGDHEFPYITPGAYQTTHGGPTPETTYGYDVSIARILPDGTGVIWCTFLGGDYGDIPYEAAVDGADNIYVVGETSSTNFPTTSGAYQTSLVGGRDGFMAIISSDGTTLNYATYLGGTGTDHCYGIALDDVGDAYVSGETTSTDFPTTTGTYQTANGGGWDAFVSKITPSGGGTSDLLYSTYLGDLGEDRGRVIVLDGAGDICLTGITASSDFPTGSATGTPYQTTYGGGGYDAFVSRLNSTLSTLNYSTYLGGGDGDYGHGLAINGAGDVYVTGYTASSNFPTTTGAYDETFNGVYDAFVSKLSPSGNGPNDLLYSTYLGGSTYDGGVGVEWGRFDSPGSPGGIRMNNIALGCNDMIYVHLGTNSKDFPTTPGAYDRTFNTGEGNLWWEDWYGDRAVVKLNPAGNGASDLLYSTYLGSTHRDHNDAIDIKADEEAVVITAGIFGPDFPTTAGAFQPVHGNAGTWPDTPMEDSCVVSLNFIDYGDAPDTYGTYAGSNGPRHVLGPLRLGEGWDAESDGNPSVNADGDDTLADWPDDEDGVTFLGSGPSGGPYTFPYQKGEIGAVEVMVTGGHGWLAGWIDWDRSGVFDNPSERMVWQAVTPGTHTIEFTVPSDAVRGITTYARFRLAGSSTDIESPASSAFVCDGEVEDYYEVMTPPPVVGGTVEPVNKVDILMPWIGLACLLALASTYVARLAHRKLEG